MMTMFAIPREGRLAAAVWSVIFLVVAACPTWAAPAAVTPSKPTAEQAEFFERRIRPLLAERCFECHGEQKQKGALRMDSLAMLMRGGSSGPAVHPGNPNSSRMIEAVRYTNPDMKMPPKAKLSDQQIADLTQWVSMGLPWPGSEAAVKAGPSGPTSPEAIAEAQKNHWALQPIRKPAAPKVKNAAWVKSPIDAFVLAKLEERGIEPSRPADKATLLRRAYFNLIGLPPTYEEVQAFVADASPDAYAKAIEKLLAMPQYGERWARHWLDIARYADTRGYQVGGAEIRYPFAYTYRDYVIDSFNSDKPYDRFIIEQLAADKLELGEDKKPLAALGFITVGRKFLQANDTLDDQIDVTVRGLMGMTIACARCHDHKFDPIPTADYYAIYGIFASSQEPGPRELPLIEKPDQTAGYVAFEKEMTKREQALAGYNAELHAKMSDEIRSQLRDYFVFAARHLDRVSAPGSESVRTERGEMRRRTLAEWMQFLRAAQATDPVWSAWRQLRVIPADQFAAKSKAVIDGFEAFEKQKGHVPLNARVKEALRSKPPKSMMDVATIYGDLLESVYAEVKKQAAEKKIGLNDVRLSDAASEQLRLAMFADSSPAFLSSEEAQAQLSRDERNKQRRLESLIEQWKASSPAAPARAMIVVDKPKPVDPYVFVRGQGGNRGPSVPRRNLTVLAPVDEGRKYASGGRLELAQAIASPKNPLTARVMVNRIWMHHFGEALCRTPADFGVRADPPTHPELLDYLASVFIESGWSVKQMHRLIMQSSAFMQAADDRSDVATLDPENRLIWKMNRRRLEFEPMRDTLLAVAGRLDRAVGGRSVDISRDQAATRRTVYAFINRQDMPGLLMNFDYPTPDVSNAERPRTTVPQQALFLMNSPFIAEQARAVVQRTGAADGKASLEVRVQTLYRAVYSRDARPEEVELARNFLAAETSAADKGKVPAWQKLAQAMLMSNELTFVD